MSNRIFESNENDPQQYYWFRNALSEDEVDQIIRLASELPEGETASTLGENDGGSTRTSKIKWLPDTPNGEFEWLYERMVSLSVEANTALWDFDLRTSLEAIQYTEYYACEEGHYDWHQDIGEGALPSKRKISITIQLSDSDDYEGGDLEICTGSNGSGQLDNNIICERGKGVGVLFPSYMMHRVSPVTKGLRRSLVLWVGGGHYR